MVGEDMLKSCRYCGRVHDEHLICPPKQEALDKRARRARGKDQENDHLRHTYRWQKIRDLVYHRDRCLCLCCLAELEGMTVKYNTEHLEVHHIIPLHEEPASAFDMENLITVCRIHHEACEHGEISRGVQRMLAAWSTQGHIDLKERLDNCLMEGKGNTESE